MIGNKLLNIIMDGKVPPQERTAIVFAKIITVNPVSIKVEGQKEPIPSKFIYVSNFCKRHFHPNKHKHTGCYNPLTGYETEDIEEFRAIKPGDKVVCLRSNGGQFYYLLERIDTEGFA